MIRIDLDLTIHAPRRDEHATINIGEVASLADLPAIGARLAIGHEVAPGISHIRVIGHRLLCGTPILPPTVAIVEAEAWRADEEEQADEPKPTRRAKR